MPVNAFDAGLLRLLHVTARNPAGDALAARITDFGLAMWPLMAVAALTLWRGSMRTRAGVFVVLFAVFIAGQLGSTMKDVVQRPRPAATLDWVAPLGAEMDDGDNGSNDSFPSNHATNSFAAAGAVAWWWRKRRIFGAAALGGAALVAIGRVYEGLHYPTDVMAGALLGLAVGCGGAWALERWPLARRIGRRRILDGRTAALAFMAGATSLRLSLISSGDFAVSPREASMWLDAAASPFSWLMAHAGTALLGSGGFSLRIGWLILSTAATWCLWMLAMRASGRSRLAGLAAVLLVHTAPLAALGTWAAMPSGASVSLMVCAAAAFLSGRRWDNTAATLLACAAVWSSPVGWWFLLLLAWLAWRNPVLRPDAVSVGLAVVLLGAPSIAVMEWPREPFDWRVSVRAIALAGPALWLAAVIAARRFAGYAVALYGFLWIFQALATPGGLAPLWIAAAIACAAAPSWNRRSMPLAIALVVSLVCSAWLTHPDVKRVAIPVLSPGGDPMAAFGGWDKLPRKIARERSNTDSGPAVVTEDAGIRAILLFDNPRAAVRTPRQEAARPGGRVLLAAIGTEIDAPPEWHGRLRPAGEPVSFDLNRSGVLFRTVTVQPFEPVP